MVIFTVIGTILNTAGALIIGWSDFLTKERIAEISVSRFSSNNLEENLKLPLAQEFLRRGRNARIGLSLIIIGTIFLILAGTRWGSVVKT